MKLFRRKTQIVWVVGMLTALCIWIPQFLVPGIYDRMNNLVFDSYQKTKPRQWTGSDVIVVDIDEDSIKHIGQWPWPRDFMAEMTDRLGKLGAATIVYDIVFSEPDRTSPINSIKRLESAGIGIVIPEGIRSLDNDLLFAEAIGRNRVVTGLVLSQKSATKPPLPKAGYGISGTLPPGMFSAQTGAIRNLEVFDEAATGIGLFSLSSQFLSDGIIRQVGLLTGTGQDFYPALALEALRVAQGSGSYKIKSSDGSGEIDTGELRLASIQVGAIEIPTGAFGDMPIYHSRTNSKPVISARALMFPGEMELTNEMLASKIEGRIVLVGTSAEGLLDLRSTPIEPVVPGVFIHADILDQILSGTYLLRPDYAKGVELTAAIIAVLVLLVISPFVNSVIAGMTALVICLGSVWFFWLQFSNGLLLFSPLLILVSVIAAYVTSSSAQFLLTEKEGAFLRGAFSQYLSPTLVDRIAKNPENLVLGGEEKELTLLFCDIRGFTALSENLDPTELTELLNSFLTPMTRILLDNGATIDKYMGDAIMAFWNAPVDQDNHRELACLSVLEMRTALVSLNKQRGMNLQIGVGLNTGPGCVGNLGSDQRFSYSAIGDAVNVASRIEGLTKHYGLDNLVAEETLSSVEGLAYLEIDLVSVVGREEPLSVYYLLGHEAGLDPAYKTLSSVHAGMIAAYRAADMKESGTLITKLRKTAPAELQKLYAVYGERITDMTDNGVPDDWDGIYRAKQK